MGASGNMWEETSRRFINPYNFVGMGNEVVRQKPESGTLTGKISCTLVVRNKLCIPDTESAETEQGGHTRFTFYRVGGEPVIPGSQLKGMVRTYYEAVSNSCLSVNNNNILSARHSFPRKRGLLKYDRDGWHLFPAHMQKEKGNFPTALKADEFRRVWYDLGRKKLQYYKFSLDGAEIECRGLEDAVKDYEKNVTIYKEMRGSFFKTNKDSAQKLTYDLKKDPSSKEMFPVFYELIEDGKDELPLVYLSPSQIGRSVFNKKLDDLLGSHRSCSKNNEACLCKACSLFGMIGGEGRKWQLAGSVRFTDAVVEDGKFSSEKNIVLKELSGPKTTSTEFYAKRPEKAKTWTYESKTTAYQGKGKDSTPVRELCEIDLRGRKFYLHNSMLKKSDYCAPENEKTKRNSSQELCSEGSRFTFDVFFENITETQLKELVWVLALGENSENSERLFKLGHGKPLGLGSVKVLVSKIKIRDFDSNTFRYNVINVDPSEYLSGVPFDTESECFREFVTIVNYRTAEPFLKKGCVIAYPLADDLNNRVNSKASHQWFIANRQSGQGGTGTTWSIKYSLPKITSEDITLPEYVRKGGKRPEQSRKRNDNSPPKSYSSGNGDFSFGNFRRIDKRKKDDNKR